MKKLILIITLLVLINGWISGAAEAKLVACVGNSNTYGDGLSDRLSDCYPAKLERLLKQFDSEWETRNFGFSGATVLRDGDQPYIQTVEYAQALASEPDVVILCFGPNGTRAPNRNLIQEFYVTDYTDLIDTFSRLGGKPEIWICYPLKAFSTSWTISDVIIRDQINPLITQIASQKNLPTINFYAAFENSPELYQPDGIHPTSDGTELMARIVAACLTGTRAFPDFNSDGVVDIDDLVILIEHWGTDEPLCDIAPPPFGDKVVDRTDLEVFMRYWEAENIPQGIE
jgi:lysophospholipase L1-like esterase